MLLVSRTDKDRHHGLFPVQVSATIALLGIGAHYLYNNWNKQSKKYPPICPAGFLETVNALAYGGFRDFLIANFQKCGRIFRLCLALPGVPMVVVVADVEDARSIYKDSQTIKSKHVYKAIDRFSSGQNIVNIIGGDEWFHRRKGMNPAFAPKRIKAMDQIALKVANKWISEVFRPILEGKQEDVSFDVGEEMLDITISVICEAALDYKPSRDERQELLKEIPLAWTEFTLKDAFIPLRRYFTWMLPERQRAFLAARKLKEFATRVIENYNKSPSPVPETVVDMIMKNQNYKSDDERAADIIILLFAGHDTTGFTLALALLELAKHPQDQSRLRKALCDESSSATATATQPDTCSYLKAVISETMRLYPVVSSPGNKTLGRDFVTKHGNYFLPKGSLVFIAQIAIARDPAIFEDPFEYKPSRWLDATEEAKRALFPFSLGNRNCIGQPLANAELYTFLPTLIEKFVFSVEEEGTLLNPTLLRLENCRLRARKVE